MTSEPQLRGLPGVVLTIRFLTELVLLAGLAATGVALALVDWLVVGIVIAVAGIAFAILTRLYAKDG